LNRRSLLRFAAAASAVSGASTLPSLARAASVTSHAPIEPGAGSWRTWFLGGGSDLRLPAPPDSTGELTQVRAMLGQVDAAMQDRIAFWDAGAPPYRWNEIANDMSFKGSFGSGNYGRIQAYLNMAIHDATVATWDSKYAYNRHRPSEVDASIAPLVATPASPSHRGGEVGQL
jgi:hypothetical protein